MKKGSRQNRSAPRARGARPVKCAGKPVVRAAKAAQRVAKPKPLMGRPAQVPGLIVAMVEGPTPYAEVSIREPVTEVSMERLFNAARDDLLRHRPRRVLVNLGQAEVGLSISDLNGLAKMIAGSFVGLVERLAIVLRPEDLPLEKFFEPSMIHRGLPTYVSVDGNDAVDWLTAGKWPPR
jgi:hypothetical protein